MMERRSQVRPGQLGDMAIAGRENLANPDK
jgi:hypothetical protein